MKFRGAVAACGLAALLATVATAPALGAARSCDRLGGTTLAANQSLRLYRTSSHRGSVIACAYTTRKRTTLGINLRLNQSSTVINGDFAALLVTSIAPKDETRDGGVSHSSVTIWNAKTNLVTESAGSITGVRFVTDLLSPEGVFAGLGVAYGNAVSSDGVIVSPPAAEIALFEPGAGSAAAGNPWRVVATDSATAPAAIDNLAASPTTLFWTQGGVAMSAPFASLATEPAAT